MRIIYDNGKLLVSLTDDEADLFYKNKHKPIDIGLGSLKVLHEDINNAMSQAWKDNIILNLNETQKRNS
tara:strand:+ start:793 stop:999 length:207 start_codon:yes stop_codon:yes gene_type:complete